MTFLPIVERELRVAARQRRTYRMRAVAAALVIVLWLLLMLAVQRSMFVPRLGQLLLHAMGIPALAFCLFAGVFLTADCLSSEKREGTLGFLFLTDLKGFDVVLGKLAATSLHAIYGLLAIFPVMGLSLLLGGVSSAEFTRIILVLLVTLFLSLAIGLFVSAISFEAREAMSVSFGLIVFVAGVFPAVWWYQSAVLGVTFLDRLLLLPSPGFAFLKGFDSAFASASGRQDFWMSLLTMTAMGAGLLALTGFILPRLWQQQASILRRWTDRGGSQNHVAGRRRNVLRSLLEQNPFYWLVSRRGPLTSGAWTLAGILFLLWLGFFCSGFAASRPAPFVVSLFTAYALHLFLKCQIAVEASRRFSEDRLSGAVELLLVTPLAPDKILQGQWRRLIDCFKGPLCLAILINVGMICLVNWSEPLRMSAKDRGIFTGMFLGGIVALLLDFVVLGWVGMWLGLRGKRHHLAVLGTLGRVMLPGWLGIFLINVLGYGGAISSPEGPVFFWFMGVILTALVLGTIVKGKLTRDFRQIASGCDAEAKGPEKNAEPLVSGPNLQSPALSRHDPAACH